ncbi:MAG: hypothetical protein WKG01_22365 [Kofleriaceae bacterium]
MTVAIGDLLCRELVARGFIIDASGALVSPHEGGIHLSPTLVPTIGQLTELLDVMIVRRERIGCSAGDVGVEIAQRNFDDTVHIVEAIKAVLAELAS